MINPKQQQASLSSQSGFTIIESLVALLVAAFLLAAIAPVIVLSVATRVQSRRVESATDAAKSYIDGLRSGTITTAPPATGTSGSTPITLDSYAAPSLGTLTCSANAYCSSPSTDLYCIDGDGDGSCTVNSTKDFVIQVFRYNSNSTDSTDPNKGYSLGLRVYRADGFTNDGVNLKKGTKQATFTGGAGDRKSPLLEITTEISNSSTTFDNFCNRLKQPTATPSPTPTATPTTSPTPQSQC